MMGLLSDLWVEKSSPKRSSVALLIPVAAMILVLDCYAVWFVQTEQTLYHADQVAYWSYSRRLAQLTQQDPIAATRAVIHTVANDDVNLLPAVPISLLMVVFGGSRTVYIVGVITIYGFAAAAALIFALGRIGPRPPPWAVPLVFALMATIWQPVFIGYLGIGGVALALVMIALMWSTDPDSPSTRNLLLAGIALAVLVLFRRWWGIWGLAFMIVVAVDSLWRFTQGSRRDLRSLWQSLRIPAMLIMSSCFTLVVLAAPIIVSRLRTDYGDQFSAYSYDSFGERMASVVSRFGLLGLLVVAVCASVLFATPGMRRTAALVTAHLACTFAIMVSIQDHSPQHWYLYSPQTLLIIGLALSRIAAGFRSWSLRATLPMVSAAALVVVFVVFSPVPSESRGRLGPILPTAVIRPQVRTDLPEVKRLLAYLDRRLEVRGGSLYVLSSSNLLSDHVLGFANLSMATSFRSPASSLGSAHVDRRDGFPRGLLVAGLVVVADPVQYHLRPEDQRVIGEPAVSFLEGSDVALAFHQLGERFVLEGGVSVSVFERIRPTAPDEVAGLSARLRSAYPDRPEIYSSPPG